jgi:hypothetical protein
MAILPIPVRQGKTHLVMMAPLLVAMGVIAVALMVVAAAVAAAVIRAQAGAEFIMYTVMVQVNGQVMEDMQEAIGVQLGPVLV